jgi:hypothetical protein
MQMRTCRLSGTTYRSDYSPTTNCLTLSHIYSMQMGILCHIVISMLDFDYITPASITSCLYHSTGCNSIYRCTESCSIVNPCMHLPTSCYRVKSITKRWWYMISVQWQTKHCISHSDTLRSIQSMKCWARVSICKSKPFMKACWSTIVGYIVKSRSRHTSPFKMSLWVHYLETITWPSVCRKVDTSRKCISSSMSYRRLYICVTKCLIQSSINNTLSYHHSCCYFTLFKDVVIWISLKIPHHPMCSNNIRHIAKFYNDISLRLDYYTKMIIRLQRAKIYIISKNISQFNYL